MTLNANMRKSDAEENLNDTKVIITQQRCRITKLVKRQTQQIE